MKFLLVIYCCCLLSQELVLSETVGVGANNNGNKPQPSPNKRPQPPLWTSAKLLTLLIILSIVIGGLLFCCCFQFSCSVTIRNFTEENTTLLPKTKPTVMRKYHSDNQLELWE
uniref:Uncharacterized protein n=1 Tax=Cacopsylla melanoneura TaxID=428564 RepID=A0A8D9AIX3_9HEMI